MSSEPLHPSDRRSRHVSPTGNAHASRVPLVQPEEVFRALSLLVQPGQVFEIRALEASMQDSPHFTYTVSGYFDNAADAVKELKKLSSAQGIYLTLNPVDPSLLAR